MWREHDNLLETCYTKASQLLQMMDTILSRVINQDTRDAIGAHHPSFVRKYKKLGALQRLANNVRDFAQEAAQARNSDWGNMCSPFDTEAGDQSPYGWIVKLISHQQVLPHSRVSPLRALVMLDKVLTLIYEKELKEDVQGGGG